MLLLFLLLLDPSACKELRWKYDADISNPANWIGGAPARGCKGVHFSPVNSAPVFVKELSTPELTLPSDGELDLLDGGAIEFKSGKKCVRLKPIEYHEWYDADSWETGTANAATPDLERTPCDDDDVVLPAGVHSRALSDYVPVVRVRSVRFGADPASDADLARLADTPLGRRVFFGPVEPFSFEVTGASCEDERGCRCHRESVPCPDRKRPPPPACLDPVQPEGFCREICGAAVTFRPRAGFRLAAVRDRLGGYVTDTHVSRVTDHLGDDVVQVVFSEREYTGASAEEARRFFEEAVREFPVADARIERSGGRREEGGRSPVLGIVFGTLGAVAAFFALLLYLNGDARLDLIVSRFNKGRGSVFAVPFFARFDNTDENLIIDSQSMAGSVADLPKSFDNPLFGQPTEEDPLSDVKLEKRDDEE